MQAEIRFMNNGPNYTRIAKKAKTYSMDSNFVKQGVDKKERQRKQEDREESRYLLTVVRNPRSSHQEQSLIPSALSIAKLSQVGRVQRGNQ